MLDESFTDCNVDDRDCLHDDFRLIGAMVGDDARGERKAVADLLMATRDRHSNNDILIAFMVIVWLG